MAERGFKSRAVVKLHLGPVAIGRVGSPGEEILDVYGKTVGTGGTTIPNGTTYIRRWTIEPLPTNPNNTVVLQVLVTRSTNRGTADAGKVDRLPDEARIITVKTRKAT